MLKGILTTANLVLLAVSLLATGFVEDKQSVMIVSDAVIFGFSALLIVEQEKFSAFAGISSKTARLYTALIGGLFLMSVVALALPFGAIMPFLHGAIVLLFLSENIGALRLPAL